jgi:hypothetical protein
MTPPTRGARTRRSGRRPGWLLLTALLVLAILASATLVFSTRVELLRLAVILSLWAAVLAAFVSVIYRRQSEVDQARARDMKFVYDLQLDREITARREYELSVEAQLRRQLSREVRAQAADEMTALRAELAALRTNLEVMLGADLSVRPALEAEPIPMPAPPGRVHSSRVNPVVAEAVSTSVTVTETVFIESPAVESPIIDVHEEPLAPAPQPEPDPQDRASHRRTGGAPRSVTEPVVMYANEAPNQAPPRSPAPPWRPPETGQGRHRNGDPGQADSVRGRHRGESPLPASAGRHRPLNDAPAHEASDSQAAEEAAEPQGQHAGGQSFSDLMAKFEVRGPVGGGGRRRRED